jgi:serine/threonine-protein kinase
MIDRQGRIKLCDLGLARPTGGPEFTSPMFAQGTPSYMAPETAQGREIDAQADVYGLGVTLYRTLLGKLPFDNPDPVEVLRMHVEENPRGLDNGDLPGALNELIRRMLAKDPAQRPPAREIGREIAALQRALPDTEHPKLYELVPGGAPGATVAYHSELDLDDGPEPAIPEPIAPRAPEPLPATSPSSRRPRPMPGAGVGTLIAALVACVAYILFMTLGNTPEPPQDPRVPELQQKVGDLEARLQAAEQERTAYAQVMQQAAERLRMENAEDLRRIEREPRKDKVDDLLPEIEAMRKMQSAKKD